MLRSRAPLTPCARTVMPARTFAARAKVPIPPAAGASAKAGQLGSRRPPPMLYQLARFVLRSAIHATRAWKAKLLDIALAYSTTT